MDYTVPECFASILTLFSAEILAKHSGSCGHVGQVANGLLAGNNVGIEDCGLLDSTQLRLCHGKHPRNERKQCGVARVYDWTRKTIGREPGGHRRLW